MVIAQAGELARCGGDELLFDRFVVPVCQSLGRAGRRRWPLPGSGVPGGGWCMRSNGSTLWAGSMRLAAGRAEWVRGNAPLWD